MSIKHVVKMGNQQLVTVSAPMKTINPLDPNLLKLIEDMKDTMIEEGGIGIAAPQIGCNQRVLMFGFENNQRYPKEAPIPFTILINPVITILSNAMVDGWEGCLSVPGLRGLVSRYHEIQYSGYNEKGQKITRVVDGFHARVVQHEYDHLDGILFPQRIKDLKYFGFEGELCDL